MAALAPAQRCPGAKQPNQPQMAIGRDDAVSLRLVLAEFEQVVRDELHAAPIKDGLHFCRVKRQTVRSFVPFTGLNCRPGAAILHPPRHLDLAASPVLGTPLQNTVRVQPCAPKASESDKRCECVPRDCRVLT